MGLAKNTDHGQASIDLSVTAEPVPHYAKRAVQDDQTREISSFYDFKAKNVPTKHEGEFGFGDVGPWQSMPIGRWSRHGSQADATTATRHAFLSDLRSRLAPGGVRLTTEGLDVYLPTIEPQSALIDLSTPC